MNITITKDEYSALKKDALAYRKLVAGIFKKTVTDPVGEVVSDFRNTKLYSEGFLNDLEQGLQKSSFGK